jgi:hypothetical protein
VGLCLLAGCSTIRSAVLPNQKETIIEPVSGVVKPLSTDYSYLGGGLVGLAILCVGYLWLVEFKKADAKGD